MATAEARGGRSGAAAGLSWGVPGIRVVDFVWLLNICMCKPLKVYSKCQGAAHRHVTPFKNESFNETLQSPDSTTPHSRHATATPRVR